MSILGSGTVRRKLFESTGNPVKLCLILTNNPPPNMAVVIADMVTKPYVLGFMCAGGKSGRMKMKMRDRPSDGAWGRAYAPRAAQISMGGKLFCKQVCWIRWCQS